MQSMMSYVSRMTKRIGNNIMQGDIKVSPIGDGSKSSCTYCPYKTFCGFDERIKGYKMRRSDGISKDEARKQVMGGIDDGHDYLFK